MNPFKDSVDGMPVFEPEPKKTALEALKAYGDNEEAHILIIDSILEIAERVKKLEHARPSY